MDYRDQIGAAMIRVFVTPVTIVPLLRFYNIPFQTACKSIRKSRVTKVRSSSVSQTRLLALLLVSDYTAIFREINC